MDRRCQKFLYHTVQRSAVGKIVTDGNAYISINANDELPVAFGYVGVGVIDVPFT